MKQIGLLSTEQPPTPLVLALAPVLAASGVRVVAAVDDFLAFDVDRRQGAGLMMMRGAGGAMAESLPVERVFWIGEPPFTRPLPVGRTLGKARFHEVVGLLVGRARGGGLHKAVLETGAYILTGLKVLDRTGALYAIEGALTSGTAAERFAAIFGDEALTAPSSIAPLGEVRVDVVAESRGTISGWAGGPLRAALAALGRGGAIGRLAEPGTVTGPKRSIARLYAEDAERAEHARQLVARAANMG